MRYQRVTQSHARITNQLCTLAQIQYDQTGTTIITSSTSDHMQWIDITADYHHINRQANKPITPSPSSSHYPFLPQSRDCHMEVECSHVTIGEDFKITVTLQNNGPMLRTIDGRVIGASTQYTGHNKKAFVMLQFEGSVTPHKSELNHK